MEHNPNDEKKLARQRWKEEKRGYAAEDKTWKDLLQEMGSGPNPDRLPRPPPRDFYRE